MSIQRVATSQLLFEASLALSVSLHSIKLEAASVQASEIPISYKLLTVYPVYQITRTNPDAVMTPFRVISVAPIALAVAAMIRSGISGMT